MNQLVGGSSVPCGITIASAGLTIQGYTLGKDESWWNCDYSNQKNCMTDVSEKWVWHGNERYCEIPEVYVNGIL